MALLHAAFLALLVGTEAFFTGLDVLDLRRGARRARRRSAWLQDELGVDDPARMIAYQRAHTVLSRLEAWTILAALLWVLYTGALAEAVRVVEGLGLGAITGGVAFLAGAGLVLAGVHLPFDWARVFVVEDRYGFNRRGPAGWLRDRALGLLLGLTATVAVAGTLLALIDRWPIWWWALGAGLYVVFTVVLQVVVPLWIAPLFHDFEPVQGDVREAVEAVLDRAGVEFDEIVTMDASRRTGHAGAYFTGLGRTRRVVLFDTMVESMPPREIQAVVAHELMHWRRRHIPRRVAWHGVGAVLTLAAAWLLLGWNALHAMFDVPATAYAGLVLAGLWLAPVRRWLTPLSRLLSRSHEREADDDAAEIAGGEPLADALVRLARTNLSNPFSHPLHDAFHATHPPLPERIRRLRERGSSEPAGR